jgi:SulP family sulfate permease
VLTVVFDLVVAIGVGLVLAALLFMKRMADVTEAHAWVEYDDEDTDPDNILHKKIPAHTKVYEINGPMFFAAAEKYRYMLHGSDLKVLIVRMRNVPMIDAAGVESLAEIVQQCEKKKVRVVFSHVNEQPMHAMEKAGLREKVGAENFCGHIDTALVRAEALVTAVSHE